MEKEECGRYIKVQREEDGEGERRWMNEELANIQAFALYIQVNQCKCKKHM